MAWLSNRDSKRNRVGADIRALKRLGGAMRRSGRTRRGTRAVIAMLAMVAAGLATTAAPAAAEGPCIQDGDGTFVKDRCIVAPGDGAIVSGTIVVTGTVDPVNGPERRRSSSTSTAATS